MAGVDFSVASASLIAVGLCLLLALQQSEFCSLPPPLPAPSPLPVPSYVHVGTYSAGIVPIRLRQSIDPNAFFFKQGPLE